MTKFHSCSIVGLVAVLLATSVFSFSSAQIPFKDEVSELINYTPMDFETLVKEVMQADLTPFKGHCPVKGYSIQNRAQLHNLLPGELECVFWAGAASQRPPLGVTDAVAVTVKHSENLGKFLDLLWQGHSFTETVCSGETKYFDQPSVQLGIRPSVAEMTVQPWPWSLAEGEHDDGQDSVILDFGVDWKVVCGSEGIDFPGWVGEMSTLLFAPFVPANPPGAGIYRDAMRMVGLDEESGCVIYLDKFYTQSPKGYVTIGYNHFLICDPEIIEYWTQTHPNNIIVTTTPFDYTIASGKEILANEAISVPGDFLTLPKPASPFRPGM